MSETETYAEKQREAARLMAMLPWMDPASYIDKAFAMVRSFMPIPGMAECVDMWERNLGAFQIARAQEIQAITRAGNAGFECATEITKDAIVASRDIVSAPDPSQFVARQTDYVKQTYEKLVGAAKAIGGDFQARHEEAVEVLANRFVDSLDEMKHLALSAKPSA